MDSAIGDLRRSCRAAADRTLRHTVGCLARRGDWTHAARGLVQLASVLAERGKPREVQRILDDAREYAVKAKDDGVLLELAILSGIVWTDLGKLDEAESVLRAAVTAAREQPDRSSAVSAGLALARCHFWRGRFLDAEGALAALETGPLCERASVRVAIAASRVAIGRGDLSLAVSKATAALDAAARLNDPLIMAQAAYAAAFSHLSVGDRTALATDLAGCLGAARAARDPLRALRARLLDAEGARRAGREGVAVALLKRVGRCSAALPATVGARCALLTDLLSSSSPAEVVKRHVAATGFGALALFAPAADSDGLARAIVDEGLEILACCQSAQDDATVLAEVCLRLKKSLNAASVAFFAADGSSPLVCDGSRLEPGIARRVCAAGQAIAPGLVNERIEGGAPVRYAGELVGALVGRWPLGAAHDPARASMILAMAAAAGGPAMAALKARQANVSKPGLAELLGVSAAIADVRQAVDRAASAPFAVLIEGESGSGKELVARALHRRSPRQSRPFCALNCAALPDDLVEAELFGHARGAFTGAVAERPGVFEESHTGTLFLDEIGELSARAQAKLLRVIQDGELRRVGENVPRRVDVRIVSATNRDLRQEVSAGRFRLDLLYRLDVIRIVVPPLRERREDVAVLVEQFWREAAGRVGSRSTLGAATVGLLARYDWPGNVRELQNVLAALAVRSPRRGVVPPTALPPAIGGGGSAATWRLDHARRTFDERFVRAALTRAGGRRARAAEELGLTRQGLTKLMTRLGISQA
jgi:DNA-binding NtrC family response regulator